MLLPAEVQTILLKIQVMFAIMSNIFQISYIVYRLLMSKPVNSPVCFRIYALYFFARFVLICCYLQKYISWPQFTVEQC